MSSDRKEMSLNWDEAALGAVVEYRNGKELR